MTQSMLLLLTVWVILPMLPAILIHLLFRQDSNVEVTGPVGDAANGPLSKLKFKATGPFAAYIIVFVGIAAYVWLTRGDIHDISSNQYWTVEIPVEFKDSAGHKMQASDIASYLKTLDVEFEPKQLTPALSKITLHIVPHDGDQFPFVTLKSTRIRAEPIDFSDFQKRDMKTKYMITKKITITALPPEVRPRLTAAVTADEQPAN